MCLVVQQLFVFVARSEYFSLLFVIVCAYSRFNYLGNPICCLSKACSAYDAILSQRLSGIDGIGQADVCGLRLGFCSLWRSRFIHSILTKAGFADCESEDYTSFARDWFFYIGMRLLLFSKKCVRLGLMNGCVCILEEITLSPGEASQEMFSGEVQNLRYMPSALLLRAVDVSWILPKELSIVIF